jgi:1-acylglycerone phosphate reductase
MYYLEMQANSSHQPSCSPGGIGYSLSHAFLKQGLRVFATARDRSKIADLEAIGIETLDLTVDNLQSVQACFKEIESRVGSKGLDYLVNNA